MNNQPSIDLPITSEAEFHAALCTLLLSATTNHVCPEGVWGHRCAIDGLTDFDVEISAVTKSFPDTKDRDR